MSQRVRKAVFPVAGLGTRFLPATKAMPKEMLPIVDKPLIQYAVEEAMAAGITDMVFVTGRHKRAIEDHFDAMPELERELEGKGKTELLDSLRSILPSHVHCIYIRQPAALGLGHAVLCARPVVGDEPFAVLLADDLLDSKVSVTKQLVDTYHANDASVLGVMDVPKSDTGKYGIVEVEDPGATTSRVIRIVEKPKPDVAPSTLAVVGRYVLEPQIFDLLEGIGKGVGGEIQLTDGISQLLGQRKVVAHRYEGVRYDCGSKRGFWEATVEYGKRHPEVMGD